MVGGEFGRHAAERCARDTDACRVDALVKVVLGVAVPRQQGVDEEAHVARLVDHVEDVRSARRLHRGEREIGCDDDVAMAGEVPGEIGGLGAAAEEAVAVNDQRKCVRRHAAPVRVQRIPRARAQPAFGCAGKIAVGVCRAVAVHQFEFPHAHAPWRLRQQGGAGAAGRQGRRFSQLPCQCEAAGQDRDEQQGAFEEFHGSLPGWNS